jgi:hypothetical protein
MFSVDVNYVGNSCNVISPIYKQIDDTGSWFQYVSLSLSVQGEGSTHFSC